MTDKIDPQAPREGLDISGQVTLPLDEIEFQAIRAQGAGGQNVNKVSSAIHLRFDIAASSLPEFYKERLLNLRDKRLSSDGILVIKAQRFRTQEKNRADALARLQEIIRGAAVTQKARRPTRPSRNSQKKRMDSKTRRGRVKNLRGKVDH
jgi:ribosome-associated protein